VDNQQEVWVPTLISESNSDEMSHPKKEDHAPDWPIFMIFTWVSKFLQSTQTIQELWNFMVTSNMTPHYNLLVKSHPCPMPKVSKVESTIAIISIGKKMYFP
jgi:hypothetical protein